MLKELKIKAYENRKSLNPESKERKQANHEDYTIKFITDSHLSKILSEQFKDISPIHVACLIDKSLVCPDDFYIDNGVNMRTILSQLVSSEMDADRMDYLLRDAYFCGTTYGAIETDWLVQNMTYHIREEEAHLALNRRALYTFDDFLISRHHMHLLVYSHHKSVIYDEILQRYMTSKDCKLFLPADIEEYLKYTDFYLYEHLAESSNEWAQRIAKKKPFRMVFEQHVTKETQRVGEMKKALLAEGYESILTSSKARLSKYHGGDPEDKAFHIYIVDQYDKKAKTLTIDECTEIFRKYEDTRIVERLYVAPENFASIERLIYEKSL